MQRIKNIWTDTNLTVKLLTMLFALIISIGGWLTTEVLQAQEVYASKETVRMIGEEVLKAPVKYATKTEVKAHKKSVACDIKELSQKMDKSFDRMGDKIDQNNNMVNAKIDQIVLILMQNRRSDGQ